MCNVQEEGGRRAGGSDPNTTDLGKKHDRMRGISTAPLPYDVDEDILTRQ
jgi:hypothetical protein